MARPQKSRQHDIGFGQLLLGTYIVVVLVLTVIGDTVGTGFLTQLASTPATILHGAWWKLFSSGLVIDGPMLPQIAAVGILGVLGIYFRGSLVFWLTAAVGHIFGTIFTYIGIGIAWLIHPGWVSRLLNQPDYGISLVWCSALGVVAAAAWRGPYSRRFRPYRPAVIAVIAVIMMIVTWFSEGLAQYEHFAAFAIAFLIVALTPQHRRVSQHIEQQNRQLKKRMAA